MKLQTIGIIRSPFKQKFGTPRQSGLAPSALAEIILDKKIVPEGSLDGLSDFSHIWLTFLFHKNNQNIIKGKIHPPRLDGEKRGIFATRTPHRPNPFGLSLVEIKSIDINEMKIVVSGGDLIDETPILDIKPYLPHFDHVEARVPDWISNEDHLQQIIELEPLAQKKIETLPQTTQALILEILKLDHRNQADKLTNNVEQIYRIHIDKWDLVFKYHESKTKVLDICLFGNSQKS
jgi:tRNA (adenine37-N6)-methyltransferase